ncbi:hypothetical protein [Halothiobacillus neapolitanus]|uniref:Uncharacterized protein n=1 Tax=Halothiobacillus neapolitanus (strain ATCC 23641 / DSM 15147 / CIP 104769 / NCIMB 8539 / c2) TaxID=555778 RepID=D0KZD2_HALNC|nr:hypothetical protein [Halothiobacillus neapolitanus]ACX95805.1 hypothetical protein Hneap_0967 [Halothiobacillus neapolitanus c2]TDN66115.1 hypothetical protein C8D83_101436 [Halothiobacillus neapolitanus]
MSTQLQYTSSIFQLALGVNAVFGILLNHYFSVRAQLVVDFTQKLKDHNPDISFDVKQKHLTKYLFRTMRGYRLFNTYFILCVALAVLSGGASFYYLLQSALAPAEPISSELLTVLAIILLVVTPAVYFSFFRASDWFLLLIRERLAFHAGEELLIKLSIETSEFLKSMDEKLAEAEILRWRLQKQRIISAIKSCTEPILHPIRSIQRHRAKRVVDRLRRQFNNETDVQ